MAQTVRKFSSYGPCIILGEFVKRTPKFIFYRDRSDGKVKRVGGWKVTEGDYIHTEPCKSCRDHAATQYPNGYMD